MKVARAVAAWTTTTVVGALLFSPTAVFAQSAPRGPYQVRWGVDLPVTLAAGAAWALPQLFLDDFVSPTCPCSSQGLNPLDQGVAGHRSTRIAITSDVMVGLLVAAPFAMDAIDIHQGGAAWSTFVEDCVVMAQVIVVSGALNQLVKLGVQRPRPTLYDLPAGDPALNVPDNYLSFYSSHTSTAFAAGLAYAGTFARRHPGSPSRFVVYGAAVAAGSAIGTLRILSGRHFTTDVLAGAAVGTAVGLLGPWLHASPGSSNVTLLPAPGGAMLTYSAPYP